MNILELKRRAAGHSYRGGEDNDFAATWGPSWNAEVVDTASVAGALRQALEKANAVNAPITYAPAPGPTVTAPTMDAEIQRVRDSYSAPAETQVAPQVAPQVALSKKPVSVKRGLLATAMPANPFNPYYDKTQAVGTEGPNPYLTRKP